MQCKYGVMHTITGFHDGWYRNSKDRDEVLAYFREQYPEQQFEAVEHGDPRCKGCPNLYRELLDSIQG